MPYQFKLVSVLCRNIQHQERFLHESSLKQQDADDRFYLNIHRMEFERVKYLLKTYLRTRITKIERHLLYIVEKDCSALLSEHELNFAFNLLEKRRIYFNETFCDKLPAKFNLIEKDQLDDRLRKLVLLLTIF